MPMQVMASADGGARVSEPSAGNSNGFVHARIGVKTLKRNCHGLLAPTLDKVYSTRLRADHIEVYGGEESQPLEMHVSFGLQRSTITGSADAGFHVDGFVCNLSDGSYLTVPSPGRGEHGELGLPEGLSERLDAVICDLHLCAQSSDVGFGMTNFYSVPVLFFEKDIKFVGDYNLSVNRFAILPHGFWSRRKSMSYGILVPFLYTLFYGVSRSDLRNNVLLDGFPAKVAYWTAGYEWAKAGFETLMSEIEKVGIDDYSDNIQNYTPATVEAFWPQIELACRAYLYFFYQNLKNLFADLKAYNYRDCRGRRLRGVYDKLL